MKRTAIFLLFIVSALGLNAQIAWLEPADPSPTDTIILTYNSSEGNEALAYYTGIIYLHTGVITQNSIDGGDWKHVIGNWGEDDKRVKMTSIGNGLHQFQFVINDFYGLNPEESPQQLAYVFRSVDGSKVGKTKNNEDVFLNVNGYMPPVKEPAVYLFETRKYLSHTVENDTLIIHTNHGIVQVIPYTKRIIEVKHFKGDQIEYDSSVAVVLIPHKVKIKVKDEVGLLKLATDSVELLIYKNPFQISFVYEGDTIIEEEKGFFKRSDNDGLRFRISENEKIYGLGERANAFNLVGVRLICITGQNMDMR